MLAILMESATPALDAFVSTIANLGFPIAICIALLWYIYREANAQREFIKEMNAQHDKETKEYTEALNNNTMAIQRLCDKMGGN